MLAFVESRVCLVRPTTPIVATPAFAKASTVAAPMAPAAPVTMTLLPSRESSGREGSMAGLGSLCQPSKGLGNGAAVFADFESLLKIALKISCSLDRCDFPRGVQRPFYTSNTYHHLSTELPSPSRSTTTGESPVISICRALRRSWRVRSPEGEPWVFQTREMKVLIGWDVTGQGGGKCHGSVR